MWQKTCGIVLRTVKYKDTGVMATVYTESGGRTSFAVSVPQRGRKSGARGALLQPLALLEMEADFRPTASVHRLKDVKLLHPFSSLSFDPRKAAIALFLAEFLYHALREEAENRPLFAYLRHSLLWLDACEADFSNFHLVFLMRLSRFLGLYPNLEHYRAGDYFDLRAACFTPVRPSAHADCLPPAEASHLARLMRMNYDTMRFFRLSRAERARCLEVILSYYRLHVPAFPVLKSPEVLKELFD